MGAQPGQLNTESHATPLSANSDRRVLIAGVTGLVGGHILRSLLDDPSVGMVHGLARRELPWRHPKLTLHQVDFTALPPLPGIDEVYLALGTTIKQAGSRAAFRAVDLDANLAVARAALLAGATRIGLVSAHGANIRASYFYSRVKGELEAALTSLAPPTLVIARPSFLIGDRRPLRQPYRLGERLGVWLFNLLRPFLTSDLHPVDVKRVAGALTATVPAHTGRLVLHSSDLGRYL